MPTDTPGTAEAARRPTMSLDGEWHFVPDPEHLHAAADLPDGEPITVPGAWEAQVARPYRIVTAWYHRDVEIPAEWEGGRVVIRFDAVMYRCTVFVNGALLGGHEGGYTPFDVDLTPGVRFGERNRLAIQVINPLNGLDEFPAFSVEQMTIAEEFEPETPLSEAPHGKQTWYSSHSGLWKPVTLERTAPVALGRLAITTTLMPPTATVAWTLETGVPADGVERLVEVTVRDPDGAEVARTRTRLRNHEDPNESGREEREVAPLAPTLPALAPAGSASPMAPPGPRAHHPEVGSMEVPIPNPVLWSIGHGHLYTAEVVLLEDGRPVDAISERFGLREITTHEGRILLNGRPIYLLGALDQDFWPDTISTPPSREALDDQIRRAQELGMNLLRCHIKVPDRRYLEAADEAGILVWAELPNWTRFSSTSAGRGIQTLRRMVETMGNHPSIIAWTIINEDWGTQLRWEPRDRRWLSETASWLMGLDPTRLVVDNSACETPGTPNFHVRTDLLDFHLYHLCPDNAPRWRNAIEDFARRPAWLWSPHGDATPRGDEPLVLSEFGSWGLPRVDPLLTGRREPWWFSTGLTYYRPTGVRRRFAALGLDRIWNSLNDLADATQWHQFEAFQYYVAQLRRHSSIQGYVVTELADAYWEANGLLDINREPKAYHERIRDVNAQDVVVVDMPRRDLRAGGRLEAELTLSSYEDRPAWRGRIDWDLEVDGSVRLSGHVPVDPWPRCAAAVVGRLDLKVPRVDRTAEAHLRVRALDDSGILRARDEVRLAILPASLARAPRALNIHVLDPGGIWGVASAVRRLGHRLVESERADLIITTELTDSLLRRIEDEGRRALVLVRTRDAISGAKDLARRAQVVLRKFPQSGQPGQRSPWEGDWVTGYSWILPGTYEGLPERNPLDFAYEEVLPDHVLVGYDPVRHRDEVTAGMFVGWVHSPAALIWSFRQGRGAITLTTLHVAPETGPIATLLLQRLIESSAAHERRHPRPPESQPEPPPLLA